MIDFPDRDDDEWAEALDDPEVPETPFGAEGEATGVQHTLAIGDGDTYVTDDEIIEDTSVNMSDPELERELYVASANPITGLPTEEEALRRDGNGDDEDNGEDPIPVLA